MVKLELISELGSVVTLRRILTRVLVGGCSVRVPYGSKRQTITECYVPSSIVSASPSLRRYATRSTINGVRLTSPIGARLPPSKSRLAHFRPGGLGPV